MHVRFGEEKRSSASYSTSDGARLRLSGRRRRGFSRRVLSWRLSITPEANFCIEAVEEPLARHGEPDIFNTDQGSQFTSIDFIKG